MSTKIEWCDKVWNPITGCEAISEGCKGCYAERYAENRLRGRFGYPEVDPFKPGTVHEDKFYTPLHWRKPRKIFTVSMGDLFHEDVSNFHIAHVFGIAAYMTQHTFIIITKRPENMRKWFDWVQEFEAPFVDGGWKEDPINTCILQAFRQGNDEEWVEKYFDSCHQWPLPNVWIGVTAENQKRADERIPLLLQTPSAVRFVSVEPMLGPVNFDYIPLEPDDINSMHFSALSDHN
ncbi:MAG: DUF5131 family protein, partial [Candidatus Peribacteraceae bacterium]|nr:DUF5131 family protein [Candidatus Peribacteraceae bacterium]